MNKKKSTEKIEIIFLELIKKKDIEDITISYICKLANLNRATFYANYTDIYDLANKVKIKMKEEFSDFHKERNSKMDSDSYLAMFKYIKDNQDFFKIYFKLESICPDTTKNYHIDLAEKYYNNKNIDYHIEFFRNGLNAVIKKWLNNGCKESPEEINEIITSEYKNK